MLGAIVAAVLLSAAASVFIAAYRLYLKAPAVTLVALLVSQLLTVGAHAYSTTITFPKLFLLGAGAAAVAEIRRSGWRPLLLPSKLVFITSALLVCATALSVLEAANVGDALRETFKAVEYALVIFVAARLSARAGMAVVSKAVPILVVVVCLVAVTDFWTGPKSFVVVHGVTIPRVSGILEGPNQLGGWIALLFPFLLIAVLDAPPAWAYGNAVALLAAVFTMTLTYSRAGLLSLAIELCCVLALVRVGSWARVAAVIVFALSASLSVSYAYTPDALAYFTSIAQGVGSGAVGTRSLLWSAAIELWKGHPLLGIGAGNFEDSLASVHLTNVKTHSNNVYLQAGVEGGLPLLLATLSLLFAPIISFMSAARRDPLLAAVVAASCGFALHGMLDDLWFFPKVATVWCLLVGMAAARRDALELGAGSNAVKRLRIPPIRLCTELPHFGAASRVAALAQLMIRAVVVRAHPASSLEVNQ